MSPSWSTIGTVQNGGSPLTDIAYNVSGDGVPVLLIQGVGVAGRAWAPQIDALDQVFQLAWYDARGIGQSPGPVGSVADMARDALEVLDALGWDSAHVVGHSLGGVIAQQLALDAPERVRSLTLMCTFARGGAALSFHPADLWANLRTMVGTSAMRRRAFFDLVTDPRRSPTEEEIGLLEGAFGRRLDALPAAAPHQLRALVGTDLREALADLDVPALVLSAVHDRIAPLAQGRELARLLGTSLVELQGGHALPVQDPEPVNQLLYEFVVGLEP